MGSIQVQSLFWALTHPLLVPHTSYGMCKFPFPDLIRCSIGGARKYSSTHWGSTFCGVRNPGAPITHLRDLCLHTDNKLDSKKRPLHWRNPFDSYYSNYIGLRLSHLPLAEKGACRKQFRVTCIPTKTRTPARRITTFVKGYDS